MDSVEAVCVYQVSSIVGVVRSSSAAGCGGGRPSAALRLAHSRVKACYARQSDHCLSLSLPTDVSPRTRLFQHHCFSPVQALGCRQQSLCH